MINYIKNLLFMSVSIDFQILDWNVFNLNYSSENLSSSSEVFSSETDKKITKKNFTDNRKFLIQLYGRNRKGEAITVSVKDYTPFFFIKVPEHWKKSKFRIFETWVRSKM